MNPHAYACAFLLFATSMNAFALLGFGNSASWKEQVLLHDGREIIVERSQTYGGRPTLDSREPALLEEEWIFSAQGGERLATWKTNFRNPPEGESLMLMLVGFLGGTPYLATSPAGCIAYNHWGRPNPPYVFFKFDGKAWQRIPLAEFPAQFKEANVVVGSPQPENRSGTLSLSAVQEDNRGLEVHHRVIVREPITKGDGNWNCPDYSSPRYTSPKAPSPIQPRQD